MNQRVFIIQHLVHIVAALFFGSAVVFSDLAIYFVEVFSNKFI